MKMFTTKWLLIIVVVVFLFFNGILLYKIHLSKQSCQEILSQMNIIKSGAEKQMPLTFSYKESFRTSLLNDNLYLTNEIMKDSLHQKIKISHLFTEKRNKMFIVRFSELNCLECVMYSIVKLRKFSEIIGVDNIVFIGSYQDNRSLHIQKKDLGIQGMNVYNIPLSIKAKLRKGDLNEVDCDTFPYIFKSHFDCVYNT
jgi:hypothetical protein